MINPLNYPEYAKPKPQPKLPRKTTKECIQCWSKSVMEIACASPLQLAYQCGRCHVVWYEVK